MSGKAIITVMLGILAIACVVLIICCVKAYNETQDESEPGIDKACETSLYAVTGKVCELVLIVIIVMIISAW